MFEKSDNMKRILSKAFFVIILTLLVQIPFNVSSAQDEKTDGSILTADTIQNTAVAADAVMLVVPEPSVRYCHIYYLISDGQGYHYESYFNITGDTVTVGDSTQMTFKGFNWTTSSEYIVVIETKKGAYKKVIKKTDMSKVLTLKLDTAFSVVLPSDMQTTGQLVDLDLLDDNGVRITSIPIELNSNLIQNGFKIPYGRYDAKVGIISGALPYVLFKHNCVISSSSTKIVFASAEIKKISLNLLQNNASKKTARIKGIGISYNSRGNYVYPTITSGTPSVLVSKSLCDITVIVEEIEDPSIVYHIEQTGVNTGSLDKALDFSLKMHTTMNLPESIAGGRDLNGFSIKNDLNQAITVRQGTKEFYGTIKLSGASGASYTMEMPLFNGITTKIPSVSEMFSISYTVPGPLTVTPSTGSVFIYIPYESGIISIEPAKPSPQLVGSTIRWNCKTFGDNSNNQYHFEVFNGSTLVASSAAYSPAKYFDWTPKEPGTKYRAIVYMSNAQTLEGHKTVSKTSAYYTISAPAPIAITSILPDKASPQLTGTKIRWTCNITGGKAPVYYYRIYKGSTVVTQSSDYSTNNYFDWTPTAAGSDYRALVYVKENGASYTTRVSKYSGYYTVSAPAPIAITSILPDKASPQLTGTKIRWTTTISGGKAPVYYYRIYKGSTVVTESSDYSTNNYFDWTPTAAGTDYSALVYVKENGASYTTRVSKASSYFTVTAAAPITITSLTPNPASPQEAGASVRWTCEVSGGISPVYYFELYDGTSMIAHSADYTAVNYIDWTPLEKGSNYRVIVYVKEKGSSSYVTKTSGYYTITGPVLKVVDNSVAAVAADKIEVTFDADIGSCSPGVFDVRSGSARDSERISYFDFVSSHDRTATFRLVSPIGTDPSGLWLVPNRPDLAKDEYGVAMSADAPSMRIIDKAAPVVLSARSVSSTSVEVKFSENVSVPDVSALLSDLSIKKASDGSAVSIKAEDITIADNKIVIGGLEGGTEYELSFLTGTSVVDDSPAHNTLVPYQSTVTTSEAEFRLLTGPADTVIRVPKLHK